MSLKFISNAISQINIKAWGSPGQVTFNCWILSLVSGTCLPITLWPLLFSISPQAVRGHDLSLQMTPRQSLPSCGRGWGSPGKRVQKVWTMATIRPHSPNPWCRSCGRWSQPHTGPETAGEKNPLGSATLHAALLYPLRTLRLFYYSQIYARTFENWTTSLKCFAPSRLL